MKSTGIALPGRVENYFRIFIGFGVLVVALSSFFSYLYLEPPLEGWMFNWHILIPVVHAIVTVLAVFLFFKPNNRPLMFSTLLIECVFCIFIDYEHLSIMLMSIMVEVLFCWGFFKVHALKRLIAIYAVYLILLLRVAVRGWDWYLYSVVLTLFSIGAYLYVYYMLSDTLRYYIPQIDRIENDSTLMLPGQGEKLCLRKLGFSDRQVKCIYTSIHENETYTKTAEYLNLSLSIVKREMADVCRQFGVKNKDELYLLFLQYNVIYE